MYSDNEPWARTETIKYLPRLLEEEIIPKSVIYESTIKTLLDIGPEVLTILHPSDLLATLYFTFLGQIELV